MAVGDRIVAVQQKLEAIQRYNRLATNDNFTEATLDELKDNAKVICDDMKDEINLIKTDIDAWARS